MRLCWKAVIHLSGILTLCHGKSDLLSRFSVFPLTYTLCEYFALWSLQKAVLIVWMENTETGQGFSKYRTLFICTGPSSGASTRPFAFLKTPIQNSNTNAVCLPKLHFQILRKYFAGYL